MSYNPIPLSTVGDLLVYASGGFGADQALTGTPSVISGGTYTFHVITRINDGSDATDWAPTSMTNWSARMDLGSAKFIGGWGLLCTANVNGTVSLGYGSDGTTFTDIDTFTPTISVTATRSITPISARYWRLSHGTSNLAQVNTWALYAATGLGLARIPIGTSGQSLKVVSGAPAWA